MRRGDEVTDTGSNTGPETNGAGHPPLEERIDLHCHSRYSSSPDHWLSSQLGYKPSALDPAVVYNLAKLRGMTRVTLTDSDTIARRAAPGASRRLHHRRRTDGLLSL